MGTVQKRVGEDNGSSVVWEVDLHGNLTPGGTAMSDHKKSQAGSPKPTWKANNVARCLEALIFTQPLML